MSSIDSLFNPKSVAVIGASHNPDKVGYKILQNIIGNKYKGKILPVNPGGGEILGKKVYQSVGEIEGEIDFALLAIPADKTLAAIKSIPENKIKYLAIVSSGFAEAGNKKEEEAVILAAKEKNIRILGPNIFGIYLSGVSLNATFGTKKINKGNIAIISQSGALGIALIGKTQTEGMGLSTVIFEGNKADLNEADFLEYLSDDEKTKVIFIYMEGVKNGRSFINALKNTAPKKPVVLVKAGVSQNGSQAAMSHTGSLSGEDRIFSAVMKECGVLRAETLDQAISWVKYLSTAILPKKEDCLIITNGGGMGILAADACEKDGINLYKREEVIKKYFKELIPSYGSFKNPLDITGGAKASDYEKVLNKALDKNEFGSVICLGCETAVLDNRELSGVLERINKKAGKVKPIIFSFVGGSEIEKYLLSLQKKQLPIYSGTSVAVNCLGALYKFQKGSKIPNEISGLSISPQTSLVKNIIERETQNKLISADDNKKILNILGITIPKGEIVKSEEQAVIWAKKTGFPLVVKLVSGKAVHKTDVGGVVLNVNSDKEILEACRVIRTNFKKYFPGLKPDSFEISKMVEGGIEMIAGAKKDPDFGTTIMVGLGGIYIEVFKDIVFRSYPAELAEIEEMIKELKSYSLLKGVRGEGEVDVFGLAEIIFKLGRLVDEIPKIESMELNPIKVFSGKTKPIALDCRIILKE